MAAAGETLSMEHEASPQDSDTNFNEQAKDTTTSSLSLQEVFTKLMEKMDTISAEVKTEIQDLKKSLSHLDDTVTGHDTKIQALENEVSTSKEEIRQLKDRMKDSDQYHRRYTVEIHGLHMENEIFENVSVEICKIAQSIGVNVSVNDIDNCHPIPRSSQGLPIHLVKFKSSHLANKLYVARAKLRRVKNEEIGISPQSQRIYMNENLTKENAGIFHRARKLGKQQKWYSVWTKFGTTFVKKSKDGRTVKFFELNV
ncbi:uncharacterized protein [Ptychodera flava]|uniref:uncharacterized protein n=1 Tax=Ptychodera flava TaxID=63121 RepID=UPI003969C5C0